MTLPRLNRVEFYLSSGGSLAAILSNAVDNTEQNSPTHQAIHAWSHMETDVPNGGFVQFFYNRRGDQGLSSLATLMDRLNLPKVATVVREATTVYHQHRAEFDVANPWDGLFGSIKEFEKLDRAFVRSVNQGTKAVEAWIREHITKLATDEDGRPIDSRFTGIVESNNAEGVRQRLEVKNGNGQSRRLSCIGHRT